MRRYGMLSLGILIGSAFMTTVLGLYIRGASIDVAQATGASLIAAMFVAAPACLVMLAVRSALLTYGDVEHRVRHGVWPHQLIVTKRGGPDAR